jgi:tetratricopeptide (TPR) repeat protein
MGNPTRLSAWRRFLSRFYHLRGTAHRDWGSRLSDAAEYERAVADFDRALASDPNLVQALYDRGLLYWRELAEPRRADQDLTRVIELEPGRADAWFHRALARQMSNDTAGAILDFEHYLREGTDQMWLEISRRQLAVLRTAPHGGEGVGG